MTERPDIQDDELQQQIFGALAQALAPAAAAANPATAALGMDAVQRARLRARILQAAATPAPAGTTTWRLLDDGWFSPGQFIEMKLLRCDEAAGTQELLVRFAPGVRVPEHSHRKEEQMIILEGECHVGEHVLKQGDVHVAAPGSWHQEITTQHGALVLLRCEYPLPVG